ncbi:UDP-2,4-diacetamido-2,4,6-trideoxy-beta-L-altropyranose hydrolase [Hymenobacter jejuensis]|uniref:UDP-2,4-diacetamido-2,4, 6-trideoxy-beta-L-altropyranose hydrolase n=1 Tax=Hymenobacter jejuensis TaxID=2502781 RepID=A0A5B7ZXS1_9BACT|nr:UDP-2,4-diacetamido-2,4,6-trideoxy-beta-L-altropyranose hydrolase [Hymenobacter jejuensis]QDA58612.1 UDP-2,4-diacetamido-2,4,6-trideoxy-beta-L-altropyranose hydrolase [Hymenobacter jejuensis]
MSAGPRVIFRADGNSRIGLGHIVRCLALAEMLGSAFRCEFIIREPDEAVRLQILGVCDSLTEIPAALGLPDEPVWLLQQVQPHDILVLDGYGFDSKYQQTLKQRRQALVCLDDLANQHIWADVVINHAGGIAPSAYSCEPGTTLCLGPAYALLRPEFHKSTQSLNYQIDSKSIFLNMGGADPENHTLTQLLALRHRFPHHLLHVVTGAAYPHQKTLEDATATLANVRLHHCLNAGALAALLAECSMMVCPPSGMAYECCAVGGLLLLHQIADNQRNLLAYLTSSGLALPVAAIESLSDDGLAAIAEQMRQLQRQVFDGLAGQRLVKVFSALYLAFKLTARQAAAADAAQYFAWANDADVRRNAIHSEPIAWPTHLAWFSRRLADPDAYLYLFEDQGIPIGQVRIEFDDSKGTIDYSVAAEHRGRGLGLAILRRAIMEIRRDRPDAAVLVGQVKTQNRPSWRVFEQLGFVRQDPVSLHHESYEVFRLDIAPSGHLS